MFRGRAVHRVSLATSTRSGRRCRSGTIRAVTEASHDGEPGPLTASCGEAAMNRQPRHDRSIVSCAVAPHALSFFDFVSPSSTTFDDGHSSWILILTSLGVSLLLGGVLTRWAKTLVPKARCSGSDQHPNQCAAPAVRKKIKSPPCRDRMTEPNWCSVFGSRQNCDSAAPTDRAYTRSGAFHSHPAVVSAGNGLISGGEVALTDWSFEGI